MAVFNGLLVVYGDGLVVASDEGCAATLDDGSKAYAGVMHFGL